MRKNTSQAFAALLVASYFFTFTLLLLNIRPEALTYVNIILTCVVSMVGGTTYTLLRDLEKRISEIEKRGATISNSDCTEP